jgi:alcohol dehydrogenase, propanol-preferring
MRDSAARRLTWLTLERCVTGKTKLQGFGCDGYFAEFAVIDARNALILPESLDVVEAAPLFCAGLTAFHGIDDCGLEPGQWIAVIGVGGLGHMGVQYAKAMELKVIAIDILDTKLEEAKKQGAEYAFNSKTQKDYIQKIIELTGGGVDAAVNFTASKQARARCNPTDSSRSALLTDTPGL